MTVKAVESVDVLSAQAASLEAGVFAGSLPALVVDDAGQKIALAKPLEAMLSAVVAALGDKLPMLQKHFSAHANAAIAASFVDLAVEYGWDLNFIQGRVGMWLALGVAVGVPGYACIEDYKSMMAAPVKPVTPAETVAHHPV